MKKRPIVVVALSLLFALASVANAETGQVASKTAVTDYEKLYNDYQDNPIRADAQYKGKLLKLTGRVAEIGRELLGHPYVTFLASEGGYVQMVFRNSEEEKIAALEKGQAIAVLGRCQGTFLSNIELDDCVLAPVQPTDFFKLVRNGAPHDVQIAIRRGADVNAQEIGGVGTTALMAAAGSNRNPDVITLLLKAGADVNARDTSRTTPLMYAAKGNENPAVVSALLKAGADVNAKDNEGITAMYTMTALMYAAKFTANPAIIAALCAGGADVNAKDEASGMTALMWSAYLNGNPDVTVTLLKAGADAKAVDSYGRTAFEYGSANEKLRDTPAFDELDRARR